MSEDIGVNVGEVCRVIPMPYVKFVVTRICDGYLRGNLFGGGEIWYDERDYDELEVLEDYPVPEWLKCPKK